MRSRNRSLSGASNSPCRPKLQCPNIDHMKVLNSLAGSANGILRSRLRSTWSGKAGMRPTLYGCHIRNRGSSGRIRTTNQGLMSFTIGCHLGTSLFFPCHFESESDLGCPIRYRTLMPHAIGFVVSYVVDHGPCFIWTRMEHLANRPRNGSSTVGCHRSSDWETARSPCYR